MQGVSQYFAGLSTCEHCCCEELISISPSLKESIVFISSHVCVFVIFFLFSVEGGGGSRFRIVFNFYIHSKVGNHSSKRSL